MNVKIPKGMNSPTVIVIGGGTMNPARNDQVSKRMDNLERKIDKWYKNSYNKKGSAPQQDISPILKSFNSKIGSLEKTIKKMNGKEDNTEIMKAFDKLVNRLEKAISSSRNKWSPSPL